MGKLKSLISDIRCRKGTLTQRIMPDCTETTSITAKGSRSSISTEYSCSPGKSPAFGFEVLCGTIDSIGASSYG
ncbi:hypothetical protein FF1_011944 [Malus domestica]